MPTGLEENSSPENLGLESCLRELERILPGDRSIDWQESRGKCRNVLRSLIGASTASESLIKILEGQAIKIGGDEHHLIEIEDAYLRNDFAVLLTDVAPRNVRIIEGIPVPFDAIAQIPSDEVMEWVRAAGRMPAI